jgi:hypothetical protein
MCHEWKPEAEFAFRSIATGKRQDHCRVCHAAYRRQHYLDHRAEYIAREIARITTHRLQNRLLMCSYLEQHPCVDCGEADIVVLEFDHRDPTTKRRDVAYLAARKSWRTVLEEIAKCDVRCANCHRRKTALQFEWTKRTQIASSIISLLQPVPVALMPTVPIRSLFIECRNCRQVQPFSEYAIKNKSNGLRSTLCRTCQREYGRAHYRKNTARYLERGQQNKRRYRKQNRARVDSYLSQHPCVDCGTTELVVLEFDHRDGVEKEDEIGRLIGTGEWRKVAAEIAKCDVRCANCHRRKTAQQLGWYRAVLQASASAS